MSLALFLLVVLAAWLLERLAWGSREGLVDLEDAGYALTHWVLVPVGFLAVELPASAAWWRAVAFLVVVDAGFYVVHRWMHGTRLGWSVHRLHHEARELGTLAVWRMTVLERAVLGLVFALSAAFVRPSVVQVAAVALLVVTLNVAAHARKPVGRWLDRFGIVCAAVHHAHHWAGARCNYGHTLTVWDKLAGTFKLPAKGETQAMGEGIR